MKIPWMNSVSARTGKKLVRDVEKFRSIFLKDIGILVHSNFFKRLAHKTQVHSLPTNDHIRTRLTHSIEVAQIGRQLSAAFCEIILRPSFSDCEADFYQVRSDVEEITQFACLAHDIGHAPFGHKGKTVLEELGPKEHKFDDNRQVVRILLNEILDENLKVSAPAVAATLKKFELDKNCYATEKDNLKKVLADLELSECRHPSSLLMEAADDIAYISADLLDYLTYFATTKDFSSEAYKQLKELFSKIQYDERTTLADKLNSAMSDNRFKEFADCIIKTGVQHVIAGIRVLSAEKGITTDPASVPIVWKKFLNQHCYKNSASGKKDYNLLYMNVAGTGNTGQTFKEIREFTYSGFILDQRFRVAQDLHATKVIKKVWDFFSNTLKNEESESINLLPEQDRTYLRTQIKSGNRIFAITDVIAGMTDRYASHFCECIDEPLMFRRTG